MSEITTLFCVFLRCSAMLMVLPVFAAQQFPVRLRLALAGFIALVCAPTINTPIPAEADWGWSQMAILLLQEACVGWTAGFVARLAFYTLEVFAGIVGIEIGLSAHAQFNPLSDSRSELFGMLAFTLGALLVFTLDAHHWMLAAMSQTYSAAPILSPTPTQPLYYFVSGRVAGIFQAGLVMAAPVMAVTFLISITF
ncbi:MAG: flagellar biosynthetic protein FliR, partial [Verrucomicrobia bacterium]|nr:flagellar biosynthetic protein FliR [Verrucomicrobiota bacterium]